MSTEEYNPIAQIGAIQEQINALAFQKIQDAQDVPHESPEVESTNPSVT